jgi:hypothetical protein
VEKNRYSTDWRYLKKGQIPPRIELNTLQSERNLTMSRAKKATSKSKKTKHSRKSQPCESNNKYQLNRALKWFFKEVSFDDCRFHGNTSWRPTDMIILALLWIWSGQKNVTAAFDDAVIQSNKLLGRVAVTTYQGLAKALTTWTSDLITVMKAKIHKCLQSIGGRNFRVGRWVPLAVDGSRTTAPRTVSNEKAFCAKDYGKGKTAKYRKGKNKKKKHRKNENKLTPPQIWVTLMWHMGLNVPWDWKLGPSNASERGHAREMIANGDFVKNTLFVGDAGFVGYEFWTTILNRKQEFMVRVGGNVHLLKNLNAYTERGKKGIVYCWPAAAMKKRKPPLVLRLVKCKVGKTNVYLLTSVLSEAQLTRTEMAKLYELRWGIELEFRSLKQIFERRTLRCRNSDRALVELEWSIMGMAIIELFTLQEQRVRKGQKIDPRKISFAKSLRAVRQSLTYLSNRPDTVLDFATQLAQALTDNYTRASDKSARYRCKRKKPPSCGKPKVARADAVRRRILKETDFTTAV